jgi:hypothetical protein
VLGQFSSQRFGRTEPRNVLTDEFVGQVALEALGAGVPCENVAFAFEHEDRVGPDAFDEQARAFLALAQAFVSGPGSHASDISGTLAR